MPIILQQYKELEQQVANLEDILDKLNKEQQSNTREPLDRMLADLRKYYQSDLVATNNALQELEDKINGVDTKAGDEQLQYLENIKNGIPNPEVGVYGYDKGFGKDQSSVIRVVYDEKTKSGTLTIPKEDLDQKAYEQQQFVKLANNGAKPRPPITNSMIDTTPINFNTDHGEFSMGPAKPLYM